MILMLSLSKHEGRVLRGPHSKRSFEWEPRQAQDEESM
jgi:hypothetical protein